MKTTEITVSWTIQQLLNNPNLRIFITNEKLDNSKSFLREIKTHFEKNDKFRFLYGDITNDEKKWTESQIIIKTRIINRKEPTIQAGSLDTSLVSQHYDIIIADDLVSRNTIATKEQMDKAKQYWKDLLSLLEVDGMIIDVGTRWHFDDLHGWLQTLPGYMLMKIGCYDEDGNLVFPEKFTRENLESKRIEIGSYDFSCLYLNEPVDDEIADFKRSWFENRYEEADLQNKKLATFITIDNAPSTKKGTDYQGIIVNSVDTENRWYLRHVERFKGNTPELINKIFELYKKWKPQKIGVEQKAFDDLIKPYLDEEKRKRDIYFSIEELMDKGIRKEDRIRGRLQGRFESKSIFLKKIPDDDTNALIDELTRFPKSQYDDLADALQYQTEIAYKATKDMPQENKPVSEFGRQEEEQGSRFHYD